MTERADVDERTRALRTIADLDGRDAIVPADLAEAIQYRTLDRARDPIEPKDEGADERCRRTSTSGA